MTNWKLVGTYVLGFAAGAASGWLAVFIYVMTHLYR